jgi:high affinity Mn2+ porin
MVAIIFLAPLGKAYTFAQPFPKVDILKKIIGFPGWWVLFPLFVSAQDHPLFTDSGWSFHFQFTGILQGHPTFHSPYSGQNSLQSGQENAFSVTSTMDFGRKLWQGASLFFDPEMAGGKGMSSTLGVAGFPNGETFRIGDPQPTVYVARFFFRQYINLDKEHWEQIPEDVNQVGEKVSTSRLGINLGKFGLADFFDNNSVSHDPRSDFMNWALMNNGAYDYAANTRGYTYGLVVEYIKPGWALRFGTALEPTHSNGDTLNFNYFKTNSQNLEWEQKYSLGKHTGISRFLVYYNTSKAPSYDEVVAEKISGTDTSMDVIYGKKYGGKKWGFGWNIEQELGPSLNGFIRLGWNDGKTATWAFAEIDNIASGGLRLKGTKWKRPDDNMGLAFISNGISAPHRNFLAAGGYGFMIGDGMLPHYTRENILELFYQILIFKNLWGTLDYQFIGHPAYNQDRGPVNVFAARVHLEW